jgi:hypothetical protein
MSEFVSKLQKLLNQLLMRTDLSAVITWVGLGLSAAEPHAL